MRGLMTEAVMQDGVLPSFDDMEFLPQEDDLYSEVFGHHDLHHSADIKDEWLTDF
ncbi:MAG: hypothetical protein MK052_04870 [Alphaproteobacteria bacterium]|nr:hypothetical protein [Alphaproteobacteria bacterium]